MDILTANKSMAGGGHGVICHIIDTGVNAVGELSGRVNLVDYIPTPDSALDTGLDYADKHGHGTMMASVLHRQAPEAMIYSYSVYARGGDVNKALARIINEVKAAPGKRHVASMSMSTGEGPETSYYTEMRLLIEQLNALGVPFVCSAGNDGEEALDKWPACFQAPITVTAIKNDGERAHFSVWLDEADFSELGIDVPCMDMDGNATKCDGTSPATAIVAGKIARVLSENPKMTELQLYEFLRANTLDLGASGRDPYYGWGWIASVESKTADNETEQPKLPDGRLTAAQIVTYFQNATAGRWGYVWSLNGELYTREMAEKYHAEKRSTNANRDPATYWLEDCAKWIGKMAADCSGGIVGAIRTADPSYTDRSANTFYEQCTEKGPISTILEIPGLCVWRDGHIGIYEGGGYVLEFRGTDYGAVRTKLAERTFTNWGKLRDIQYETEGNTMKVITKNLNYDKDVQVLQTALNALGYDCGVADGKAGKMTMDAIEAFCAAHSAATVMPDTLALAVEVNGKKYALNMAAQN